ncbi:hypothetical protein CR513_57204, partial [Mucuna pruriens]
YSPSSSLSEPRSLASPSPLHSLSSSVLFVTLSIAGFITSGAFGISSLSSFAWLATYLRRSHSPCHEEARDRVEVERQAQKTGQEPTTKAQEAHKETSETQLARQENKTSS